MTDPRQTLTAAVVGGGAGGRLSIQALARSERFHLLAAADLRPEVLADLERDYPGLRTFTDHREMFATCPTDVVCVSTYPPSHESVALDALALPLKGILVEKPLGHTAASGRRILEAVKHAGIPMAVPHGLLAKKTPLEIIARVQDGEIGDLTLVEIQCAGWDIINAGIHWLDFVVTLTRHDPVLSVLALCDTSTRTYRDGMQVETVAITSAQTQSGLRIVMYTGDEILVNRPGKATVFNLIGTAGQIEFWGWEDGYILRNAAYPAGTIIIPEEFSVIGHQRHLENLAAMVARGEADYAVAEDSLRALEVCEAAYLASRRHCQVTLPLERFTPPPSSDWDPGMPYGGVGGGRDGRAL